MFNLDSVHDLDGSRYILFVGNEAFRKASFHDIAPGRTVTSSASTHTLMLLRYVGLVRRNVISTTFHTFLGSVELLRPLRQLTRRDSNERTR